MVRPSAVAEIAAGGLKDAGLLSQLAVAYAAVALVSDLVLRSLIVGFSWAHFAPAALGVLTGAVSLLVSAFALYFVAHVAAKPPRFMDVLTGYAFVQVLAGTALVVLCVPAMAVLSLGLASEPTMILLALVLYLAVVLFYLSWYIVGLFDMGCLGSGVLGLVAVIVAAVLQSWLDALLGLTVG